MKEEREKLYETAIESRRTIETIAQRVTALYFKLKCNELYLAKQASRDSTPPQQRVDIQLTTIGGGVVSERNIVNLMELIEMRSIQIVDAYLRQLTASKRPRRSACLFLVSLVRTSSFVMFCKSRSSRFIFSSKVTQNGRASSNQVEQISWFQ